MPTVTASSSVEDAVVRRRGDLLELSHSIHAEPELAFAEHRSARRRSALVAERGFEITDAPGGLDTAFRADLRQRPAGRRGLRRIRRAAGDRTRLRAQHHRRVRGRHRAGAGRGRRRAGSDGGAAGHPGRGVRRWKSVAARAPVSFDDIAADGDGASRAGRTSRRHARWRCRRSRCATAAANHTPPSRRIWGSTPPTPSPSRRWPSGCCASSWRPGQMMHGIVTDGGRRPTSSRRAPRCATRCAPPTRQSLRDLEDTDGDCFLAGALATGCDYEVTETEPSYPELTPDAWLADVFRAEMLRLGRTPCRPKSRLRCRWAAPTWATSPR